MVKFGVNSAWFRGLKDDEKEKMRQLILSNQNLLDKLLEIMYNIDREAREVSSSDYDNPSWSHKQAHLNGRSEVIRDLIKICTVKEREDFS